MGESREAPIKVMIVDDSAIIRGLMTRALKEAPDIEIIATAADGQIAVDNLSWAKPDVIVLDIEMPNMDGLTALPKLVEKLPSAHVIMASTLTLRNAEISMKAMELGATDYLPKPTAKTPDATAEFFRDLITKVRALAGTPTLRSSRPVAPAAPKPVPNPPAAAAAAIMAAPAPPATAFTAAKPAGRVAAIAIASSTGGPQALQTLFGLVKNRLARVPVFITQHMPPTFTTILAEHLAKAAGVPCREAKDGEIAAPGTVYVAPGDFHMVPEAVAGGGVVIRLNQNPPENFCRPAADPMLRALAGIYGAELLTLVLTGMGQDGLEGAKVAAAKGGLVVAQDQASCVVWGMPRAVTEAGVAKVILPLDAIPDYLARAVQ